MELTAAAIEEILGRWPVADLATLGDDGRPHLVPIVFARVGGALWSPIDGKPKSGRELARIRNLRRDPRVTLLLQHYDDDWTRLWWLRLAGEAQVLRVTESDGARRAAAALRAKYPEYARVPLTGPEGIMLRIAVGAPRSWCASEAAADSIDVAR
jgi:PPOX class probable F420-dependent enzyme